MVLGKKQLFVFAGIGLVASGVGTIILIYYSTMPLGQAVLPMDQNPQKFKMEEVHSSPNLVMHNHTRVELWHEGQEITVPAEIGITAELWHDHSLDEFGPSKGLVGPLHTHDETGTVHIESIVYRNYTLGEFLSVWGLEPSLIEQVTDGDGNVIQDYPNHVLMNNELLVIRLKA